MVSGKDLLNDTGTDIMDNPHLRKINIQVNFVLAALELLLFTILFFITLKVYKIV